MEKNYDIQISVRNLVEFVLRSGDLDTRFMGMSRAIEGTKAHQKIQKSYKENYTPEVSLSHTLPYRGFIFKINGRVDGILQEGNEIIIDEIKSTTRPLSFIDEDHNLLHWAQAKCYGYIYAAQNQLEVISLQLTYYQLDTEEIKFIRKTFTLEELYLFFTDLLEKYFVWANLTHDWMIKRNLSIKNTSFPFPSYRRGQREFAVAVYRTIAEEKRIFVQAPTGIGKTISTLFPGVKAMGEGHTSKIFYLTAKTITRQVAEAAFVKMAEQGLLFKTVTLTAKDKVCFEKEASCNPEQCSYAMGHFNRVNAGILEILEEETIITRELIEIYAQKHHICPFEFSLDLSLWVDGVICDYNYVFDPRVYLKRFFTENGGDYTFLIDEAHNLVDRGREMFSAELHKKPFLELKGLLKTKEPKIAKALNKINSFMASVKKSLEHPSMVQKEESKDLYPLLRKLIKESEEWLAKNEKLEGYEELLTLYFDVLAFLRISEFYDERYVTLVEKSKDDLKIKLYCLDPSYLLGEALKRGKSAVFFSATLTPLPYFREILGGSPEDPTMQLASPFERKNLCLMIADQVSTKYKDRENSYDCIVEYIETLPFKKPANYLVFFPSYAYMNEVFERFSKQHPELKTIVQASEMKEEEREDFLQSFVVNPQEILIGFAVLGGIFSEGIDLIGERLSGAVIVGVGLPQICMERDIIMDYFQKKNRLGYEYAYTYPGMNKVLQAAGRVIRAENDRGVVLLIDERFSHSNYRRLFPQEWSGSIPVRHREDMLSFLKKFWNIDK